MARSNSNPYLRVAVLSYKFLYPERWLFNLLACNLQSFLLEKQHVKMAELKLNIVEETKRGSFRLTYGINNASVFFRIENHLKLSGLLQRLPRVLVGQPEPGYPRRATVSLLQEIGIELWKTFLIDPWLKDQKAGLAEDLRNFDGNKPLLLDLPPALEFLPWELLYDPDSTDDSGFLARRRPLVRLVEGNKPYPPIEPPLRVLLLISSPPSMPEQFQLQVESERLAVENALKEFRRAGWLHLQIEDRMTLPRVQQALIRFQPHLVHYIGHGDFLEGRGGWLTWEDNKGGRLDLPGSKLAELFGPRSLRAVLLHGCRTAESDQSSGILGVADALIKAGIPTVVAQQANFTYYSNQLASEAFYTALTAGQGMPQAIFEVRQALTQRDRPDWAVPRIQCSPGGLTGILAMNGHPGPADPALTPNRASLELPAPIGIFVGRQWELRQLQEFLEQSPGEGSAVIHITGPGGAGKSSLVAQAVHRFGKQFKGALTLSCEAYRGFDQFLQRLGDFLKRQTAGGSPATGPVDPTLPISIRIEEVIQQLDRAGPFLLVIDNLEKVQSVGRTIIDEDLFLFLQKLLTNMRYSRAVLISHYTIKGLLPGGKFTANLVQLSLGDLTNHEIEQLFERHPRLNQLDNVTRTKLIDQFGGFPFIYDLLAGSAANLSLTRLITDVQGHITREQELRAKQEWELVRQKAVEESTLAIIVEGLTEPSRWLLGQISVFAKPFPLGALEDGLKAETADWTTLIDWGLLHYDPHKANYSLHSLTAYFARTLLEPDQRRVIQKQLAEWYIAYARNVSQNLDDYLEAYRFWHESGELQKAGEMALELSLQLRMSGLYGLVRNLNKATTEDLDGLMAARARQELGNIALLQGDYKGALKSYELSQSVYAQLEDLNGQASILHQRGILAQQQGNYPGALAFYSQSHLLFSQRTNEAGMAGSLHQRGMIFLEQGKYIEAQQLFEQSLAIKKRLGDLKGQANSLHQLGILEQAKGNYKEAGSLYDRSLTLEERLGDPAGKATSFYQKGELAQIQGDYSQARKLYEKCLTIREELGDLRGQAAVLHMLGLLALEQGDNPEAENRLSASLVINERLDDIGGIATSKLYLGMLALSRQDYDRARLTLDQSLNVFTKQGDEHRQGTALYYLAVLAQEQLEEGVAEKYYQKCLTIFRKLGDQLNQAAVLHQQGLLARERQDYTGARQLYTESLKFSRNIGSLKKMADTLYNLGRVELYLKELDQAGEHFEESSLIYLTLGDPASQSESILELGRVKLQQKKNEEARTLLNKSLTLMQELKNYAGCADIMYQLGTVAQNLGEEQEAYKRYTEAWKLFDQLKDTNRVIACLFQLGKISQNLKDYGTFLVCNLTLLNLLENSNSELYDFVYKEIELLQQELGSEKFAALVRELETEEPSNSGN